MSRLQRRPFAADRVEVDGDGADSVGGLVLGLRGHDGDRLPLVTDPVESQQGSSNGRGHARLGHEVVDEAELARRPRAYHARQLERGSDVHAQVVSLRDARPQEGDVDHALGMVVSRVPAPTQEQVQVLPAPQPAPDPAGRRVCLHFLKSLTRAAARREPGPVTSGDGRSTASSPMRS